MSEFEAYLYERFAAEIRSWSAPDSGVDVTDVYALSFLIDTETVEPKPEDLTIALSYNTVQRWQQQIARASDSGEARWNFAFWTHDIRLVLPSGMVHRPNEEYIAYSDQRAIELAIEWRASLNLPLDEDSDPDWNMELDAFAALCASVGRRLHDEGIIVATFGRPVPIILHDLEYWDRIVQLTHDANPPGVADEFDEYRIRCFFETISTLQSRTRSPENLAWLATTPQSLWELIAKSCHDDALIRDRIRQLAATPGEQGLREAGLWTSADWAEHDLPPPWLDAGER